LAWARTGGGGLREDLVPRELRRLLGEVGVADRALGGAGVLERDAQAVHGRTDRELLERAEAAAELADLLDGLVQDLLDWTRLPLSSELGPPLARLDRNSAVPAVERCRGCRSRPTAMPTTPCRSR
jgi:hypothetical protein